MSLNFLPMRQSLFYFFAVLEILFAHGLGQLTRDVKSDIRTLLAGDQWWPRTSVGRLRFAHAITHLLRQRFVHFVKSNN